MPIEVLKKKVFIFKLPPGFKGVCTFLGPHKDGMSKDLKGGDIAYRTTFGNWWCTEHGKKHWDVYADGVPFPMDPPLWVPPDWSVESKPMAPKPVEKQKRARMRCFKCQQYLCPKCHVCETDKCEYIGLKVTTREQAVGQGLLVRTQKAKGFLALSRELKVPVPFRLIGEESDIKPALVGLGTNKQFIRGCPERPRHGFVDSRPMEMDLEALKTLTEYYKECQREDPNAEVLVLPYVESQYNLIVTPYRVAVGPGHDGATAGIDSKAIPLSGAPFGGVSERLYAASGINTEKEDPYFEAVLSKSGTLLFTQVRAGEKLPPTVGADYVPYTLKVDKVIEAAGDLLEWERQVHTLQRGTVVYKLGGTLISHYGVHCTSNKIPCFTSRIPEIGEELDPEKYVKVMEHNSEAFIEGLKRGVAWPLSLGDSVKDAIKVMLLALHNDAAMREKDTEWLGVAVAVMLRVGMAASHGEARHAVPNLKSKGRSYIYGASFLDFLGSRKTLGNAQYEFKNYGWSRGYGGKLWADCTDSILELEKLTRNVLQDPKTDIAPIVTSLNLSVNKAHNNGWWLNKFTSSDDFDKAAQQNIYSVSRTAIAIYKNCQAPVSSIYSDVIDKWREAPDIEIARGKYSETMPKSRKSKDEKIAAKIAAKAASKDTSPAHIVKVADFDYTSLAGKDNSNYYSRCNDCKEIYHDYVAYGAVCGKSGCPKQLGEAYDFTIFNKKDEIVAFITSQENEDYMEGDPINRSICINCGEELQHGAWKSQHGCGDTISSWHFIVYNAETLSFVAEIKASDSLSKQSNIFEENEPAPSPDLSDLSDEKVYQVTEFTNVGDTVPLSDSDIITAAQARYLVNSGATSAFVHLQYRTNQSTGYYSKDIGVPVFKTSAYKDFANKSSWAEGSDKKSYIPLTVELLEPGKWRFSHPEAGLDFEFQLGKPYKVKLSDFSVPVSTLTPTIKLPLGGSADYGYDYGLTCPLCGKNHGHLPIALKDHFVCETAKCPNGEIEGCLIPTEDFNNGQAKAKEVESPF